MTGRPAMARHVADRMPPADLDLFPEAGHLPWYDHVDDLLVTLYGE